MPAQILNRSRASEDSDSRPKRTSRQIRIRGTGNPRAARSKSSLATHGEKVIEHVERKHLIAGAEPMRLKDPAALKVIVVARGVR